MRVFSAQESPSRLASAVHGMKGSMRSMVSGRPVRSACGRRPQIRDDVAHRQRSHVAFVASMATSMGRLADLDFWSGVRAAVRHHAVGHSLEMRAIGQAQGALSALTELLPDEPERVETSGGRRRRAG